MGWVEILGFATGAVCVYLAVLRNIWTFPIGLANNVFFLVLFVESGLYADASLQIVYGILGGVGWWQWLHGGVNRGPLRVARMRKSGWPIAVSAVVAAAAVLTWVLSVWTDSTVPLADGLTTALSLVAQVMLNRKWIQNWYLWILADVIYVGLYAYKGLWLTSVLYAVFIVLCVVGYRTWKSRDLETAAAPPARTVAVP